MLEKMTRIILFLVLLPLLSKANSDSVKKYYIQINKAEMSIIDLDYKSASNAYSAAFTYKYPNGKDLYNCFLVSYYMKDTNQAITHFNELARKGMKKADFEDTLTNYSFYKFIAKDFDSIYNASKLNDDTNGINFWRDVHDLDQMARNGMHSHEQEILDKRNSDNIVKYLEKHSLSFKDNGFWLKHSKPSQQNLALFLNAWHSKIKNDKLDTLLLELCLKGEFPLTDLTAIYLGGAQYGYNKYNCEKYFLKIWNYDKLSQQEIEGINQVREEIYLEPLLDYKRKYEFQLMHLKRFGIRERNMFLFLNSFQLHEGNAIKLLFNE